MKVVTYIHTPFADAISSSHEFIRSCDAFGYEVINVAKENYHVGNGEVLRLLYNTYKDLDEPICYADGADSFFLRPINIPTDRILYSTEKNIWPQTDELAKEWGWYYFDNELIKGSFANVPAHNWPYLNGGGYCGPSKLLAEFFDKYGLDKLGTIGDAHSQRHQTLAFLRAQEDGFPIELDQLCTEFQTIGFFNQSDFSILPGVLYNNLTGSTPALIHGNGRTDMGWIYQIGQWLDGDPIATYFQMNITGKASQSA